MLCCLAVKGVQQCYVTRETHQQCYQKTKSSQFGHVEGAESRRNLMFSDSFLAGFMTHYYAVVCLPHICGGAVAWRGSWKWPTVFCVFIFKGKHAQYGVIMARDSEEAFVEMWEEKRGDTQPTLRNTSISITCLITNITYYSLSTELLTSYIQSFSCPWEFPVCSSDCTGHFWRVLPRMLLKGRMFIKWKADRKHRFNNIACTMDLNSGVCSIIEHSLAGYVWAYLSWVMWIPAGKVKSLFLSYVASVESYGCIIHQGNLYTRLFQGELATFPEERNQSISYSPAAAV